MLLCHTDHSQEHPDANSTPAYLTGSSTATTTEEEVEEAGVVDEGKGQKGKRGLSSAAWISGRRKPVVGVSSSVVFTNNCFGR